MELRIADTFTGSLSRLTGDEQKAVKTTAFDLQMNPAGGPGMQFHKLDKAKDKNFWSVRVSRDLRLIVHKTASSLLLCYVDHHDAAYQWAERRRLEIHPKTGAAQLIEIRERVEDVVIPRYVEDQRPALQKPPLFARMSIDELMSCGVPLEWLDEVVRATEDTVLDLATHLPAEAAEALLVLATGGRPSHLVDAITEADQALPQFVAEDASIRYSSTMDLGVPSRAALETEAFEHPDAQRRFRTVANVEELERALDYPWEKWTVFLHPAQRQAVEKQYGGPARVSGSAGTGKTVVALHRAVYLARANPDARVLLTTFSETLANALRTKLRRLIGNEPRIAERLEVYSLDGIALRLHERNLGQTKIASAHLLAELLKNAAANTVGQKYSPHFLQSEWEAVVDAWQLTNWEAYRDVARLGRKTRLPEAHRKTLWDLFERVRADLSAKGLMTLAEVYGRVTTHLLAAKQPPFEFVVVDEAQDIGVAQLRFLAALGAGRPEALFFAGDLGQRIFQQPFSWKALGVDMRGRSRTLRINYRTSHQIRAQADRLLGADIADVDGNNDDRRHTTSVFNGPEPRVEAFETTEAETAAVAAWLGERVADGLKPHELALFVRSEAQFGRARAAADKAGISTKALDERVEPTSGHLSISTMHLAKGLEFRAVAVMACDDGVLPLQERIEAVTDDSDLEDVYNTERHLLYVACTRARDGLLVTGIVPASEFLDDLKVDGR